MNSGQKYGVLDYEREDTSGFYVELWVADGGDDPVICWAGPYVTRQAARFAIARVDPEDDIELGGIPHLGRHPNIRTWLPGLPKRAETVRMLLYGASDAFTACQGTSAGSMVAILRSACAQGRLLAERPGEDEEIAKALHMAVVDLEQMIYFVGHAVGGTKPNES